MSVHKKCQSIKSSRLACYGEQIDVMYSPKGFSQVATSQGYFPKWQDPKCESSQAQLPKSFIAAALDLSLFQPPSSAHLAQPICSARHQPVLAAAIGPLAQPSRFAWPPLQPAAPQRAFLTFGKLPLWKLHICEVATCEIVTWEGVALGKMPLGKYLTPTYM